MATWKRKPQEQAGNYFFAGVCYLTAEVDRTVPKSEIHAILADLHKAVQEENGIDYLQVYESEDGTKVWVIDQVPKDELHEHPTEHNHYTILFPHEY
jgi:hypothetical protein